MNERLFVATRKGLFEVEQQGNRGWAIARTHFLGDPVTMVLPDPRSGAVFAALNLGHFGVKLQRSLDGGRTWSECGTPRFPPQPEDAGEKAPAVSLIWSLEASGNDEPGTLWAGTIPGGLFRSRDNGETWELARSLWQHPDRREWMGGGYDEPGIHSICVDPRDSGHVTVAVSIGGVWTTADGGESWRSCANGMRAEYMPPARRYDPIVQDPHRVVQCAANPAVLWAQHHNGIFRTTDGAANWHEITEVNPSAFGFAVAVHPSDPDTAWFVPAVKDECRIPVDGRLVVTRTRDGGKTFERLRSGLPDTSAYDLVYRHGLDIDRTGERLALGSTTGNLWLSEDQGETWRCLSTHLPPVYCVRFACATENKR